MNQSHFMMSKILSLLKIATDEQQQKDNYIKGCKDNLEQLLGVYKLSIEHLQSMKDKVQQMEDSQEGLQEYALPDILKGDTDIYDFDILQVGVLGNKKQRLLFCENLLKQWQDDEQYYINKYKILNTLQLE